jgi:hypothetical protein
VTSRYTSYPPPGHKSGRPPVGPVLPPGLRLAEAYVPWQTYDQVFSPREALEKGTLFPELFRAIPPRKP